MPQIGRGRQLGKLALLLVGCSVVLSGCWVADLCKPDPQFSQTDVHSIYKQNCAGCHGEQLQGVSGPALTQAGAKYNAVELEKIILEGSQGMPGFKDKLSDPQVVRLVSLLANEK
ncbi:c-type cytochrome [Tumebacillus permanentifrigoris]|uniref:Cbb3-type cytochrome c oxidase subunit III n=1 Tax=Tumebacillus permanentifrigoris TaxID=378543 RepID=A0A316D439_9BACL|nr:cytochrome c [Tumebacillus permanentifrigoris]PWK06993.1 cbb3-type cytochrome c oxidase subunit III [Tumebacillus permanentifrigoris]